MSKKTWLITALLLLCAPTAFAQINITVPLTVPPYGAQYRPFTAPVEREGATTMLRFYPFASEGFEVRSVDGWEPFSLSHVLNGFAYYGLARDIDSTFGALKYPGVREGNPIARPFVNAGEPVTILVGGLITYWGLKRAERLREHENPFARALGWAMPPLTAAVHLFAAGHNDAIAAKKRARYGY